MDRPHRFDWRERGRSFIYAWQGLRALVRTEHNVYIHLAAAVVAVTLGVLLGISRAEWCVVALCIGMVLAAEAFNSAIEALADKVCRENDPLIGRAKDLAAGGVLLAAAAAATAGAVIFLPRIIDVLC